MLSCDTIDGYWLFGFEISKKSVVFLTQIFVFLFDLLWVCVIRVSGFDGASL